MKLITDLSDTKNIFERILNEVKLQRESERTEVIKALEKYLNKFENTPKFLYVGEKQLRYLGDTFQYADSIVQLKPSGAYDYLGEVKAKNEN